MLELFRAGGWSMFVVLLLGGVSLAAAVTLAVRQKARLIGVIRALSTATVFATVLGVASDLAAVFSHVPVHPEWSQPDQITKMTMIGLGESLSPAILGFSLLTLVWVVTAVGVRRMGDELEA